MTFHFPKFTDEVDTQAKARFVLRNASRRSLHPATLDRLISLASGFSPPCPTDCRMLDRLMSSPELQGGAL